MAQNYKLKQGVLLQAFGDASKTVTNDSPHFTDELAKWYLDTYPEKAIYFAIIPGRANVPSEIRNRPPDRPAPTIIVPPEKEVPKIAADFIDAATKDPGEPKVVIKPPVKKKGVARKSRR